MPETHDSQTTQNTFQVPEIIVDPEFEFLLPLLDKETYALLEQNILANGCRDALVTWGNVLVDGHNRLRICRMHDIPFKTVSMNFDSRSAAIIWIIGNQVSRRNLLPIQLSHFRGLHYQADKKIMTNPEGKNQFKEVGRHYDDQPKMRRTVERLSEQYKVSPKTIERDAKVAQAIDAIGEISPEAKRKILSGDAVLDKKVLQELSSKPKQELTELAAEIQDDTYTARKLEAKAAAKQKDSADILFGKMRSVDTAIDKFTEAFVSELPKVIRSADKVGLRIALRSSIDQLEELYKQL